MFRSVFTKYVITFMVALGSSFLLLLFIVNNMVEGEARRNEQTAMAEIADSCAAYLSERYAQSDTGDFRNFVLSQIAADETSGSDIRSLFNAVLTCFEDMTVYVTDANGDFIFCTGQVPPTIEAPLLSSEDLKAVHNGSPADERPAAPVPTLNKDTQPIDAPRGAFTSRLPITPENGTAYILPIEAEGQEPTGYIVVSSSTKPSNGTPNSTLRSMIAAALWIMLAALIAIYFITERVISPLREMSKAAKRMAVGQFDVRVPVRGRDEVAQLAVAFNQMAGDLDNLERMRNSFVANVSHDLRTPMTTIAGFIDGILDGVIPPEQERHYLKVVSDEVRRLSRLVTALLDLSRLQTGDRKLDMQPFDICEMGRQILISFEKKIDDKRLDVEFVCSDERMFVLADRDAIHQILYNICDNAVKFSSEQGKLKMSFTWSESDHSRRRKAVVKIYNEGQGIPAEDIPFIFDRFYKSDKSRSLDKSGVGLGMFISKTIIDAHGETISVTSEYGHDCEFSFTLARTDPPAPKGRNGAAQGGTL